MTQKIKVCFASTTFTMFLSVITLRNQFVTYISSILKLPSHKANYCLTGKMLLVHFCPRRATAVNHQITSQYPEHPSLQNTCAYVISVVMKHLETNCFLTESEHGFRESYPCDEQFLQTLEFLASSRSKNKQIDAILFDLTRFFIRVLAKLKHYNIRDYNVP